MPQPTGARITAVEPRSAAHRAGVLPNERLTAINGAPVDDILDVQFHGYDASLTLTLQAPDGSERTLSITKPEGADLGIHFADELFDGIRTCQNQCLFCFIDQNRAGMRDSCYLKDDDTRLSLLTGSYLTLTNLRERDVNRIITQRISPINVSVHTTDRATRVALLKNKRAGEVLDYLPRLAQAGITLNGQIVVCPGYNDGEQLTQTLKDLTTIGFDSISVVPVGLTAHRQTLPPLRPVDADVARDSIQRAAPFNRVYCADELYLTAGLDLPDEDHYDEFPQIENGVGMLANFQAELEYLLEELPPNPALPPFTLITGTAAAPFFNKLLSFQTSGRAAAIENTFFGTSVTVAGLVTGGDIIAQRSGKNDRRLLIPSVMLRYENDLFLDNTTPADIANALGCAVQIVPPDAASLLHALQNPAAFAVERTTP